MLCGNFLSKKKLNRQVIGGGSQLIAGSQDVHTLEHRFNLDTDDGNLLIARVGFCGKFVTTSNTISMPIYNYD